MTDSFAEDSKKLAQTQSELQKYRYVHTKSKGVYDVLAVGRLEGNLLSVCTYRNVHTGEVWTRDLDEFMDGRFEPTYEMPNLGLAPDNVTELRHCSVTVGAGMEVFGEYDAGSTAIGLAQAAQPATASTEPTPAALERLATLERVVHAQEETISQILGKALGFPWYKDDQKNFPGTTEKDGVCTGDLIAEDLANMAADILQGKMNAKQLTALIRAWLDNDDASHWGDFEKALNMILEADL